MTLTMRQISNQNLNDGYIQLNPPTISITASVLEPRTTSFLNEHSTVWPNC